MWAICLFMLAVACLNTSSFTVEVNEMILEYVKPIAEIISFVAMEKLATDDPDRNRTSEGGGDGITIPSMPDFSEGVEDW